MSDSKLDELNAKVTAAVFDAEHLERDSPGSDAAREAYSRLSRIEEQIARITSPYKIEGEISRRGVITAALKAQDWERARGMANAYLGQGCPPELAKGLRRLRSEADAAIRKAIKKENFRAEEAQREASREWDDNGNT